MRSQMLNLAHDSRGIIAGQSGVLAVLMDSGRHDYCHSLVAVADGTLSLYLSNGGGTIGTGVWRKVNPRVREFVHGAAGYLDQLTPATEFPLPEFDYTAFYVVTPGQVLTAQHKVGELENNQLALSPLFHQAHQLIATIRHVSEMREREHPLVFAVMMGELEMAGQEINNGADPNMPSSRGVPVAALAASGGASAILQLLLKSGADPEARISLREDGSNPSSLLSAAASFDDHDSARVLLDAGAHIDAQDGTGFSAVHVAAYLGNSRVLELLLGHGANFELRDQHGYTPLMMAANAGKAQCVKQLLEAGAQVNATDQDGSTPIMFAAQHGYEEIVQLLLSNWADPTLTGTHGLNATAFASQNGHAAVVKLLKAAGG